MTTMTIEQIRAGDEISYSCAFGLIPRATVNEIIIARNAADQLIPWLSISFVHDNVLHTARIGATESILAMHRVGAPL